MEVILEQDFPALGFTGDIVVVKNGYGRNFLIPRGIASEASSRKARILKHKQAGINARKAKLRKEAEALSEEIRQVELLFTLKLGEQGRSFGSITNRDLQAKFAEKGHVFDRKQITLRDAIKAPGQYSAEIRLHSEVTVEVEVKVEGVAPVAKKADAEPEKGSRKKKKAEEVKEEQDEEAPREGTAE